MKKSYFLVLPIALLSACTTIRVDPIATSDLPNKICIEENPRVIVGDFLTTIRNRIEDHGIKTTVYSGDIPENCEYTLTYTALKNWDMATYLHHAELRLEKNGNKIGYAEYHLNGKGGLSLTKWQSTKTKMDPVVDQLLGKSS